MTLHPGRFTALPALVALALISQWQATAKADPPGDDNGVVHAILVADTNDDRIGDSVKADLKKMQDFLDGFKAKNRLGTVQVISGESCNLKGVNDAFAATKVGEADTLFFYFAGHGINVNRGGVGHTLAVGPKDLLIRSDLRGLMLSKRARLDVMITDTCNSYLDKTELKGANSPEWDTLRCLFLVPRGVVDINSVAEGESAFGNEKGGFFTAAFLDTLGDKFSTLDRDGDKFLHWHEVIPEIQKRVQTKFSSYRTEAIPKLQEVINTLEAGKDKDQLTAAHTTLKEQPYHTVRVYSLPPVLRFGVRVLENGGNGVTIAVVHEYTPAAVAGLRQGDIIYSIAGAKITSAADIDKIISGKRGDIEVEYTRAPSSKQEKCKVKLPPWDTAGKDS
jgi:hypothetical protein